MAKTMLCEASGHSVFLVKKSVRIGRARVYIYGSFLEVIGSEFDLFVCSCWIGRDKRMDRV